MMAGRGGSDAEGRRGNPAVVSMRPRAGTGARLSDPDLEAQIIGAVLSDNALFKDAAFLDPDQFADSIHAELWALIQERILAGSPATPTTLAACLGARVDALGGRDYLGALAGFGSLVGPTLDEAAEKLRELSQRRALARLGEDLAAWTGDAGLPPDEAFSRLMRASEGALKNGRETARRKREVAKAAIAEAIAPRASMTTGIEGMDFLMHGGLIPKRLYGIGGLFGRGKTILLGTISDNLNARSIPHLVVSLETPPEDYEIRSCAKHLRINASSILDQDSPMHAMFSRNAARYADAMPDFTLYEHHPGATMDQVHRMIVRAAHRHGIRGFILDYWQLLRGQEKGISRDGHLNDCADRLAAICRREDLWGIVAAQTEESGKLRHAEGLAISSALYLRLQREENDEAAYFVTEKSNYTRYADTGSATAPGMIFDQAGPHFRDPEPEDLSLLAAREAGNA